MWGAGVTGHGGARGRQLGHGAGGPSRPVGHMCGCGRAGSPARGKRWRTRVNQRYLSDVRCPIGHAGSRSQSALAIRRSSCGGAFARVARRRACGVAVLPANAVLVSATKGLETDSLQRMSQVLGGKPNAGAGRRAVRAELRLRGRARAAGRRAVGLERSGGGGVRPGPVPRAGAPPLRQRRRRRRRDWRRDEERDRDRVRSRRRPWTWSQCDGGAHHARAR